MIVMRDGEYLAKRVHIKCTGSTKKFGRGILYATTKRLAYESEEHGLCFERPMGLFPESEKYTYGKIAAEQGAFAIRNNIGFYDFKSSGKHDFQIVWYENSNRFEFNGSIQKHNGERPRNLDLYARLNELVYQAERHYYDGWSPYIGGGSNRIWHDGEHVECAVVQPDKIPKHVDNRPLFNIFIPDLGDRINSGEFRFMNANGYFHNETSKEIDKMTGETYEDQYRYEKHKRFLCTYMEGNYDFVTGLKTRPQVIAACKEMVKHLKAAQDWYKEEMSVARRWIQESKERLKDPCDFTSHYKKIFSNTAKNPSQFAIYLNSQAHHQGTLPEHLALMTQNYEIIGRIHEIIGAKYTTYQYVREFTLDTIAMFEALKKKVRNNEDMHGCVLNAPYKQKMALEATNVLINRFHKKLTEPL